MLNDQIKSVANVLNTIIQLEESIKESIQPPEVIFTHM